MSIPGNPIEHTLSQLNLTRERQYENFQFMCLAQALLGSITPTMIAITIHCINETVHIYFLIEEEFHEGQEEIEEILCQFEVLQMTTIPIKTHILTKDKISEALGIEKLPGRALYIRRLRV